MAPPPGVARVEEGRNLAAGDLELMRLAEGHHVAAAGLAAEPAHDRDLACAGQRLLAGLDRCVGDMSDHVIHCLFNVLL